MDEAQRRTLTTNLVAFCADMMVPEVLTFLQARHIFNDRHVGEIQASKTDHERRHNLIRLLQQRGPAAFAAFYEALVYSRQEHLADLLTDALPADYRPTGGGARSSTSPPVTAVEQATPPVPAESAVDMLEPPTAAAVDSYNAFYQKMVGALNDSDTNAEPSAGTSGVSNLKVECSDALPPSYVFEDVGRRLSKILAHSQMAIQAYPNFSQPKGLALIINNRLFVDMEERRGSDADAKNLRNLFCQLGYNVQVLHNLGAAEMTSALEQFGSRAEHGQLDSAVVVVLSHGEHGAINGSDGRLVQIDRLVGALDGANCRLLRRKPKLFFLQTCRGAVKDPGYAADQQDGRDDDAERVWALLVRDAADANATLEKTPTDADMMIAYSTTPGYVSWRNEDYGSYFVQALCLVFARYAVREDLLSMMTRVNRMIADHFTSGRGYKQVSEPTFRLTKKFYFLPGYSQSR